ncbi:capsule biosynthesis protein [Aestuariibacter sp. A3R04]|uniref:capsule biosynthesis protein n=1 Tax=Aestuariibacter sp. A3R04 TaxID=2841571 RepID=UPI001C0A0815|nr:capsule biosynthesis protein [Aestuariibacter sp. A3R04]MBU3022091.1 capsule biosynthesis protein [Aestuariibacter sp. A3R04]
MNISNVFTKLRKNKIVFIVAPWLLYAFYLVVIASPQYESVSKLIIKSTDGGSSFDPTNLLVGTIASSVSANDSQIIESYIQSQNMMRHLENTVGLSTHFSGDHGDVFSRLPDDHTQVEFYQYYLDHVTVEVDSISSVITLKVKAFTADFAQTVNHAIVVEAERFLNEINNNLAKAKMDFAKGEHQVVEEKLKEAKNALLAFQSTYNVLDPTAEGAASQQIAFSLQATLAQKRAELNTLQTMMSPTAPEVQNLKRQIGALQEQVDFQKETFSNKKTGDVLSVTEQMAQYSNLQIQMQLAIQAFSSSLVSLENARVEAYQKLQHLVTIETPTHPDDNAYPEIIYNLVLFGVILLIIYGSVRIIIATIKEL